MNAFFFALGAIAFFILGLSITLIRKGRNLQGDVGENDDMQRLGLECTSQAARREEFALRGEFFDPRLHGCSVGSCGACATCDDPTADSCTASDRS